MDGTQASTNWIIAGLVALVVIVGGGWLVARERAGSPKIGTSTGEMVNAPTTGSPAYSAAERTTQQTPSATARGETVTVKDQPAGMNVIVADVTLMKPSWVAIRDTKGWILGVALFGGTSASVVVPLVRGTVAEIGRASCRERVCQYV